MEMDSRTSLSLSKGSSESTRDEDGKATDESSGIRGRRTSNGDPYEVGREAEDAALLNVSENSHWFEENDGRQEIGAAHDADPALSRKMHLVNDAIDEIGWTGYHWKLFVLNGFGYAVDSLLLRIQAIVQPQVAKQWHPSFERGLTVALYAGLLAGALFWGLTADIIGRKLAFNVSLMICSICAIAAGTSPNFSILSTFIALSAFGGGGNLIMDTTVFVEYLPSKQQWLLTLLGAWWSLGEMVAALISWPLMADFSCETEADCTEDNNKGWRYVWYILGSLVLVMSLLRFSVIHLKETPKFLLSKGRDDDVVQTLQELAVAYNRPCSLTPGQLRSCGTTQNMDGKGIFSFDQMKGHMRGLFVTKQVGKSTILLWTSWTLIGLAYPLYNVFLPEYLASRGAQFGEGSIHDTYRNFAIVTMAGIWGPLLAGLLCEVAWIGRRGTLMIGALITMVFLFAYTRVQTPGQNLGFNCAIEFSLNVYYASLYAYTAEVLPSAHRATGNGIGVAFNRLMGIFSAVVATVADTKTTAPIFVCAALYIVMAIVAFKLPFEPYGRRSA